MVSFCPPDPMTNCPFQNSESALAVSNIYCQRSDTISYCNAYCRLELMTSTVGTRNVWMKSAPSVRSLSEEATAAWFVNGEIWIRVCTLGLTDPVSSNPPSELGEPHHIFYASLLAAAECVWTHKLSFPGKENELPVSEISGDPSPSHW